jgi:hypothetical protein
MPIRNPKTHTPESVEIVASRLDAIVAQLRVSKTLMELEPPMQSVEVEWQNALDVGLKSLRTWADSLRDAVDAKRQELAVSRVSDSAKNSRKHK